MSLTPKPDPEMFMNPCYLLDLVSKKNVYFQMSKCVVIALSCVLLVLASLLNGMVSD